MPTITLVSSDGQNFVVEENVAKWSLVLKTMIEDLGIGGVEDGDDEPIPLANIRGEVLERIVTWIQHHVEQNHTPEQLGRDEVSRWDGRFLRMPIGALRELAEAANYLNVVALSELCRNAIYIFGTQ